MDGNSIGSVQESIQISDKFSEASIIFNQAILDIADIKTQDEAGPELPPLASVEDVRSVLMARSRPAQSRGDRPAADGTFGKTEYTVVCGDTLRSIAAAHGQSVDDILIANPWLHGRRRVREGMTIALLDDTRLAIAREMATTCDPARLQELVQQEILYATMGSATPEDLLPALKLEMLARRGPCDHCFAAIVEAQSQWAMQLWTGQGRVHAVMDKLRELAALGDRDGLKQEILNMLRDVANSSPTAEAIAARVEILRTYGPQDAVFVEALNEAVSYFNVGQVQEAAAAIADAYAQSGPIRAAELLAQYTASGSVDPLTAARILNAAQPTVAQIISHLGYGDLHEWPGGPEGETRYFHIDLDGKETIFAFLSTTVQSVSRTAAAESSVRQMADLINVQLYTYVARSIAEDKGIILPIEMLKLNGDLQLATMIFIGVKGLASTKLEWARSYANTVRDHADPATAWNDLIKSATAMADHARRAGQA
ncbi:MULTISPECIES: LysM domain-containing protein [Rhodomicrobium]|uniref:LysM peptidoglycan-binding domain-containing protein n=1 Tax=Rhodomicrobium TaxID=1068 RepID=UPI000B4B04F7|nr:MULTISPECIES: LysM domain-containing protein [Rhodomicrobium]